MITPLSTALRGQAALAAAALGLTFLQVAPATATTSFETVVVSGVGDLAAAVQHGGGTLLRRLPLIHGAVARLPRDSALPGFVVAADRALTVASAATPTDGPASTVRATLGLGTPTGTEGAGVTVAVIDTGVADVPDLAGRVTHVDITGQGTGDAYGHGTFIAGLIAGDGSSSGGAYAGIAPAARILDIRVGHDDGSTSLVEVMQALQVVADHHEVSVVNLSLSSESPLPYQLDPLTQGLEALWAMGDTVVVPAGNDGTNGRHTITSPGIDPTLITVGGLDEAGTASHRDDTVAPWSSQGPAPQQVSKPDLVAPGAHLVSTGAPGSLVWQAHPEAQVADGYLLGSGTSFATAVVAGSVALLVAERPQLTPDRVKTLLRRTSYDVRGPRRATGTGGLDVAAAQGRRVPRGHSSDSGGDGSDDGTPDLTWDANAWGANAWAANAWSANAWAARQWAARQWSTESWG